jgi:putative ABC transport system permease protein
VSTIHVAIRASDITDIAGIGAGIGLLATAVPGLGILRLNPRMILLKGE